MIDGPMVLETSPNVLWVIDDFWFRNVTDFGRVNPAARLSQARRAAEPGHALIS